MVQQDVTITVDGVKGKDPIAELNKLIEQRSRLLHQSTAKATAATAVTVLKSLRAATKDARKTRKFRIKVEDTSYFVGFSQSEKKPCLRSGPSRYSPKVFLDSKVVFLTKGIANPMKNANVYKVTYEKSNLKPVYIACLSKKVAMDFATKATKHRIDEKGTLAKNAMTVAIGKVAQKSFQLEGSNDSKRLASTIATVNEWNSGLDYTIKIQDNLVYASDAIKGGESAIDTALQKAANKVYGTLAHLAGLDFTDKFPEKPFPDVGNKKRV